MGLILNKGVAPAAALAAGKGELYFDSVLQRLCWKDSDTSQVSYLQSAGLDRNYIVNGGHFFAQRQAPATLTTYSNTSGRTYAADRWTITNENASAQYQRVDTLGGIEAGLVARYYGRYKKITSAGKMVIAQAIEGVTSATLRGDIVRVQAKMKYTVAAGMTVRLGLAQLTAAGTIDTIPATFVSAFGAVGTDPTLGTNLAYLTPIAGTADGAGSFITGNGLTCTLAAGWTRFSCNFLVPVDCKNLVMLIWTNGQPVANDELNISEAGIYDSADIHDWVELAIPLELAAAQRFCAKSFDVDILPAQNVGLVGAIRGYVSVAGAVAAQPIGLQYPVAMRVAPTFTFYNPSVANAFLRNTTAGSDATATAGANIGVQGADIQFTGIAAWTVAQAVAVHFLATAEI